MNSIRSIFVVAIVMAVACSALAMPGGLGYGLGGLGGGFGGLGGGYGGVTTIVRPVVSRVVTVGHGGFGGLGGLGGLGGYGGRYGGYGW